MSNIRNTPKLSAFDRKLQLKYAEAAQKVETDERLRNAAPDMYAALKKAEDVLEDLRVPAQAGPNRFEQAIPDVLAVIRAAIAKAEGK